MARHLHDVRDTVSSLKSWVAPPCAGILVCLAACGGTPPQAVPVAHAQGVPVGYAEFRDAGRGYSVAVPSSWIQINVQSPAAAAEFAKLLKQNPQFARVVGSDFPSLEKQQMSLLAVAPKGADANMVVTSSGISGTLSAAELGALYSSKVKPVYSRVGWRLESHQIATLDGYPDLRIQFGARFGSVLRMETQFMWGLKGKFYVLTISGAPAATTDEIAGTVRFT